MLLLASSSVGIVVSSFLQGRFLWRRCFYRCSGSSIAFPLMTLVQLLVSSRLKPSSIDSLSSWYIFGLSQTSFFCASSLCDGLSVEDHPAQGPSSLSEDVSQIERHSDRPLLRQVPQRRSPGSAACSPTPPPWLCHLFPSSIGSVAHSVLCLGVLLHRMSGD